MDNTQGPGPGKVLKPRAPKKKPTPKAVYKTSLITPDPIGSTSDDETVIMRLNVNGADHTYTQPDAYNPVKQLSRVERSESNQSNQSNGSTSPVETPITSRNTRAHIQPQTRAPVQMHGQAQAQAQAQAEVQAEVQAEAQAQPPYSSEQTAIPCPDVIQCAEGTGAGSGPCTVGMSLTMGTIDVDRDIVQPERKIDSETMHATSIRSHEYRVVPLLAEFSRKSRNSDWPSVTSICCYWCCTGFSNTPVGLPIRKSGDLFHVTGCFCSLECAAAYNFGMPRVSVDRCLERFMLINALATELGVGGSAVKPAPDRLSLSMFGGPLAIEEFRTYGNSGRHVMINQPPMLTLMQQVEEVDEMDMKSAYSYIPLDIARVEKFQEKVRLRRSRPLVDPTNTLDHCMKLKYASSIAK